MSWIPELSDQEIQELASQIPDGLEEPQFSILNELFKKGFGYSQFESLHDRLNAYVEEQKPIKENENLELWNLISNLLQHFKEKKNLPYKDYDAEFNRCKLILFPKGL